MKNFNQNSEMETLNKDSNWELYKKTDIEIKIDLISRQINDLIFTDVGEIKRFIEDLEIYPSTDNFTNSINNVADLFFEELNRLSHRLDEFNGFFEDLKKGNIS